MPTQFDFEVYGYGLVHASVCTNAPPEEILGLMEKWERKQCGEATAWALSEDATFYTGQANPCVCEDHADR